MKIFKRLTALFCTGGMLLMSAPHCVLTSHAAQTVKLSPDNTFTINNGEFEGWGTSLCWWANRLGYSDSLAQQAADVFYGDEGLRLNIARFNIGGGDDPSHNHITRTDSNMPGYTKYSNGKITYDWSADANQRNVLMRSIQAAGDDMIVEMFSNSPPYYMTKSGCSSGSADAKSNNLKDDQYDDFARYFAEVCYHYQHDWGVKIQSAEAMNEPYTNFWKANSYKQEGCHFDQGSSQSTMIVELQKAMRDKGMGDVILCGTDETSIDTQISSFNKLSNDAKKAIGRIDTHTYGGSKRAELKNIALSNGKNLWMSEVDSSGTAGTNAGEMSAALWLAQRITTDVNDMNASAWIMWQVIDSHISKNGYNGRKDTGMVDTQKGYWGVAVANHDENKIVLTKKYYAFGQYSRYIRPGMIMLNSSGNTVAAYDPEKGQIVAVSYNTSGSSADITFDLSDFAEVGSTANAIRTSKNENWKNVGTINLNGKTLNATLPGNSITTFVIEGNGSIGGNEIKVQADKLSGSDSWKQNADTDFHKAFDGDNATYFDGTRVGWVQADLGAVYDLSALAYCPRQNYEYRMVDGYFEVSMDGTDWQSIHTISENPTFAMHKVKLEKPITARYIRYAVPEGKPRNSYNTNDVYCCNVAEIKLYGTLNPEASFTKLAPEATSGTVSWKQQEGYNYGKAFDGDTATYFDGVGAGWVQADLGKICELNAIAYTPRKGYEARMVDGYFSVSEDGTSWQTVHTIGRMPTSDTQTVMLDAPVKARYIRYAVPEGKPNNGVNTDNVYCCNIAELAFYGAVLPNAVISNTIKVEYSEKYHQVRFTWDKVEGADRYGIAVYLAGKWRVQAQNITDTVYTTPKNLTPGRTYKVAIAARVNGKWDTANAIKHSGTVTIR